MAVSVIPTIVLLAVIQFAMCDISPQPSDFFRNVKGNLTKIVWSHAVNSIEKLNHTLAREDTMMLEADVIIGNHTRNGTTIAVNIPIMAHPPDNSSALSLENFLNLVTINGTKGIKLDFKSPEAFNKSQPIINKFRSSLKFPVFLNADILRGPVNASNTTFDGKDFLKTASRFMPEATLSVGWTTRYEANSNESRYTSDQIKQMIDFVTESHITQSVSYPVRASLAANDIDVMTTLIKNTTTTNATLTIWSVDNDTVNTEQLSKLIRNVGLDKVYLDVTNELKDKLNLSGASTMNPMISLGATLAFIVMARML